MQNGNLENLKSRRIVLGVCSSIAIYKAAEIVSLLTKAGAQVSVVMTDNAAKLMSERIFQTLSKNKVYVSMWENVDDWKPEHISLAESADLLLVAPATANMIGCFASAIAPDFLSTLYLATTAKVLIAPAMNCNMYAHKGVQANIAKLRSWGVEFIEPETGMLACAAVGKGRLASPEAIVERAAKLLSEGK